MTKLNIFISGASLGIVNELKAIGYNVVVAKNVFDDCVNDIGTIKAWSLVDVEQIKKCDVHIVCLSNFDLIYRVCEVGYSVGVGKLVLVYEKSRENVHTNLPYHCHMEVTKYENFDWHKLLAHLERLAKGKAAWEREVMMDVN